MHEKVYTNTGHYHDQNTLTVSPSRQYTTSKKYEDVIEFSVYEPNEDYDGSANIQVNLSIADAQQLIRDLTEWIENVAP